jgi:ABC-type sugar transport system ATPase subunit/ribose/xylose/arabinose/galactoside ABC-type transport system permease subunit
VSDSAIHTSTRDAVTREADERRREGRSTAGSPVTVLSARGISKRYGPVLALAPTDLELAAGEIHALVGENGSGKSTLVGIVSGTVAADTGTFAISGTEAGGARPSESQRLGAITVFQDGSLIDELSVARNLYLGALPANRPAYSQTTEWARAMVIEYGLDVDVTAPASRLSAGDRQLVEIVRAVAQSPKVLILDEATSALDARGVDTVLELMRRVAERGSAVLFVTHRLSEVMRVAHRVSVLRDGQYQGTRDASAVTSAELVELMAGTKVDLEFPDRLADVDSGEPVMQVSALAGPGFGPVDLELRAGQIVGIAGADGNGQMALLRALAALDGGTSGTVRAGDRTLRRYSSAVDAGVVYLSSDRKRESLFGGLTVADNLGIGVLGRLSSGGVMNPGREARFVAETVDRYRIRVGSPRQQPPELSGGNQQKVALGRVLAMQPRVLLVDEPTQGVDVRSRMDIYRFLRAIADSGSAVVAVSSDASELGGLCDRIVVMSRGKVTAELAGRTATEESIVGAFAVDAELDVPAALPDEVDVSAVAPVRRRRGFSITADAARLVALVVLMVGLALFAQSKNSSFLSELSIYNVLLVATPLVCVAAAQYFVLLIGSIDVSVGATMTLTVVILSFWATSGSSVVVLLACLAAVAVCGVGLGGVNSVLIERFRISSVIATIATLGIASGLALMLRPTAAGVISVRLADWLMNAKWGPVPIVLVVLVAAMAIADAVLRRTGFGLRLRAVGLNSTYANRLGVRTVRARVISYFLCSSVAAIAGVLLAAQVGIGDPNAASSLTLLAIAAPVLGGAAVSGGHGSLVGAAVGAFVLVLAQNLVTVLGLSDGTSYVFAGSLTLLALLTSAESLKRIGGLVGRRRRG